MYILGLQTPDPPLAVYVKNPEKKLRLVYTIIYRAGSGAVSHQFALARAVDVQGDNGMLHAYVIFFGQVFFSSATG